MRAAVFHSPGKPITIERLPDPKPARDEVLVKICRCGICGSDVSMTSEGPFSYATEKVFGHEFAGEVVEVGRDVTDLKVGDRIACVPCSGCGTCDGCRYGNPLFCTGVGRRELSRGFAELIAMPPAAAIRLPQSLSLADGALVEPMACGLHALRIARIQKEDRVLVLGAGSMAVSAVYWARRLGAGKIVVLSRSAHRNDLLRAMGADAVHNFEDPPDGPHDIVIECVGKEGMLNKAVELVRTQGTVISMGMCLHGERIVPGFCTFKEVRMLFPLGYSVGEFIETVKAFEADQVKPERMVSSVVALDDFPATLEELRAGMKSLKVHVDPHA